MKEKAPIKSASLKFEKQTPERQERLRQWLAVQGNYTESIFSLIEHMIDRFGYVDVKDHEVSKRLYLEQLTFNQNTSTPVVRPVATATESEETVTATEEVVEPRVEEKEKPVVKRRNKADLNPNAFLRDR